MIDKLSDDECCVCGACKDACPKAAIQFSKQVFGFEYPSIDKSRCIRCQKCEQVCPVLNKPELIDRLPKTLTFAARSQLVENRMQSSSGAVFYELGKWYIEQGGYVCGTVFTYDFSVKHKLTNSLEELQKMRGSKYAQSDMSDLFIEIKRKLDRGERVLFCGCPCQVAALRNYCISDPNGLLTVDFVCHGIPSEKVLKQYCRLLEGKYKSKIERLQFRNKHYGWHRSSVSIAFKNKKRYLEPITVDPYMKAFLSGTTMKESCYSCHFKGLSSGSDLTLGDLWGAEVLLSDWDDNTGISVVMVNTQKGLVAIEQVPLEKTAVSLDDVLKYNRNIMDSTEKNACRVEFLEYAKEHQYGQAIMHYFDEKLTEKFMRNLRFQVKCMYYWLKGRGKPLY